MPTESRTVSRAVEGKDAPHVVVTSGSRGGAASAAAAPARKAAERSEPEADRGPIPIRGTRDEPTEEQELDPQAPRPSWSLPSLASLAVWAEDALLSLGPRRYLFVLELATFADLLPADAQDVLAGLIDAEALDQEDTRPLNVNECLVVLRQLDAIVHGEKVVRLPRRRGIRHRRIR